MSVIIPDLKIELPDIETPYTFKLDSFQKYAIRAIQNNENVLVTAKTGSGKTLVGEYQIYHSLKRGKRVFYTTPIKSLSNQKFNDLKKLFPSVGIMTGDIKFMPQADIVIMTTEILRNLLYHETMTLENLSLDNLDAVVFDEVHYINDPDRGKVWEECITLLNPSINLVLLSATVYQPEIFASWIAKIKEKPIHLIATTHRVVPLIHKLGKGKILMDSKFHRNEYKSFVENYYTIKKQETLHRQRVKDREEDQVVKRGEHLTRFEDRLNKLLDTIDLPALFFVFSRKLCSHYARSVTRSLLSHTESSEARSVIRFHLNKSTNVENTGQYQELIPLLEKGIAYHHSGLLPVLKEIIEILFDKGFIKVLFATETFAVGINMPTKTVVFTSYRKFDGKGKMRMLTPSEYTQMAGRAGRRGKDDVGIVIYFPIHEPEEINEVENMMTGTQLGIVSQMKFDYNFVLSSFKCDILPNTLWLTQQNADIEYRNKRIQEKMKTLIPIEVEYENECYERYIIERDMKLKVNLMRKQEETKLRDWMKIHNSPFWENTWIAYKRNKSILLEIEGYYKTIEKIKSSQYQEIQRRKELLENFGYISNNALTEKGRIASEIHEGDPLLMSHLFLSHELHELPRNDIIIELSVFLEDVETDEIIPQSSTHTFLNKYIELINDSELQHTVWELSSYWIDPIAKWIHGENDVCEQYGIEYGNFVKAVLKLANIVDEWINIATSLQDTDMVEKMKDTRELLVRDFVVPDSLYLRI